MPDKTKISTTHAAQTTKINNGNVAVRQLIVKKPPKPLFVLFAYGGGGSSSFESAAKFKKRRLEKKYRNAEIRIIKGFKYPSHFKAEWTKLYKELTKPETTSKYSLWEIHYFGHGAPESLNFKENTKIYFNGDIKERLPWHPDKGIFVLHSCRGGAYEDTENKDKINNQICLAKTISEKQQIRCLGQTIFASFATDWLDTVINAPEGREADVETTAEEDASRFEFRPDPIQNFLQNGNNKVLWGYALLTGKTYKRMKNNLETYERIMKKPYPIYQEIKKLGPKNQILPCRVFNKGVLEKRRIVEVNRFNSNDMDYI